MDEKIRYSDTELEEFRQIILEKLDKAQKDYEMLRNGLFPNARVHMETNTYLFLRGMSMSLKESGLDLSAPNMQTLTKYVEPAAKLFESGTVCPKSR